MSGIEIHTPVMLREVVAALNPQDGGIYIDGTFGRGGYSEAILAAAATTVFGIDRDPDAVTFGTELGRRYGGRLRVLRGRFGDMYQLMRDAGVARVDGGPLGARRAESKAAELQTRRGFIGAGFDQRERMAAHLGIFFLFEHLKAIDDGAYRRDHVMAHARGKESREIE